MKTITITVSVDGNEVSRNFDFNAYKEGKLDWDTKIEDMLETLAKSNEKEF